MSDASPEALIARVKAVDNDAPASVLTRALPWLAGAALASGQLLAASRCTVPEQGQCSACGSCAIAIGGLLTWAWSQRGRREHFFIRSSSSD